MISAIKRGAPNAEITAQLHAAMEHFGITGQRLVKLLGL